MCRRELAAGWIGVVNCVFKQAGGVFVVVFSKRMRCLDLMPLVGRRGGSVVVGVEGGTILRYRDIGYV